MKREVAKAIEALERAFPSSDICTQEDGDGGAYVIVEDVAIGSITTRRPPGWEVTSRRFTPTLTSILVHSRQRASARRRRVRTASYPRSPVPRKACTASLSTQQPYSRLSPDGRGEIPQGAALSGRTAMSGGDCDILVTSRDHQRIVEHLFPGDEDEHGAILRAGIVLNGSSMRLLIQDVRRRSPGQTTFPGDTGTGHWRQPSFTARFCNAGTRAWRTWLSTITAPTGVWVQ